MFRDYINKFLLDHNIVEVILIVILIFYFIFRDNYFYLNNLLVSLYFYICLFYFNFSYRLQFFIFWPSSIRAIYGGTRATFYSRNNHKSCDYCGLRKPCCLGDNPNLPNFLPEKGWYHTWMYLWMDLFYTFPRNDVKLSQQVCRLLRYIDNKDLSFIKGYRLPTDYNGCKFKINYLNSRGNLLLFSIIAYSGGKFDLFHLLSVDKPINGGEYLFFRQHLLRTIDNQEFDRFASKLRKSRIRELSIDILRICLVKDKLPTKKRTPFGGLEYASLINCLECGSKCLSSVKCYKCLNSKRD